MCTCIPSPDWSTQCEAVARKTGKRCPHNCRVQLPNTMAAHNVLDGNQFCVHGRPVHLCHGHARSFERRKRRGLTVKLIDGGYVSAYNQYGFGSVVQIAERPDLSGAVTMTVPAAWGVVTSCGKVPDEVRRRLKIPSMSE